MSVAPDGREGIFTALASAPLFAAMLPTGARSSRGAAGRRVPATRQAAGPWLGGGMSCLSSPSRLPSWRSVRSARLRFASSGAACVLPSNACSPPSKPTALFLCAGMISGALLQAYCPDAGQCSDRPQEDNGSPGGPAAQAGRRLLALMSGRGSGNWARGLAAAVVGEGDAAGEQPAAYCDGRRLWLIVGLITLSSPVLVLLTQVSGDQAGRLSGGRVSRERGLHVAMRRGVGSPQSASGWWNLGQLAEARVSGTAEQRMRGRFAGRLGREASDLAPPGRRRATPFHHQQGAAPCPDSAFRPCSAGCGLAPATLPVWVLPSEAGAAGAGCCRRCLLKSAVCCGHAALACCHTRQPPCPPRVVHPPAAMLAAA